MDQTNRFISIMEKKSDEQLVQLLRHDKAEYTPEAIEAAENELNARGIDLINFVSTEEVTASSATAKKSKEPIIDEVSMGKRLLHGVLDYLILGTITVILLNVIYSATGMPSPPVHFLITILLLSTLYAVFEYRMKKTPAKFITKTMVVKVDGSELSFIDAFGRSFLRIISILELIVFFATGKVMHDILSKTKVVKDK